MSRETESFTTPDKTALTTVLTYLKNKNLKETEEVLKKELGLGASDEGLEVLASSSLRANTSGTEPEKYVESYSSHAPPPSSSSLIDLTSEPEAPNDAIVQVELVEEEDDPLDENGESDKPLANNTTMETSSIQSTSTEAMPLSRSHSWSGSLLPSSPTQEEEHPTSPTSTTPTPTAINSAPVEFQRDANCIKDTHFVFSADDSTPTSRSPSLETPKTPIWVPTTTQGPRLLTHRNVIGGASTTQLAPAAPFIYQVAGGIHHQPLPLLTLLPNASSLIANHHPGGPAAVMTQPILISPSVTQAALGCSLSLVAASQQPSNSSITVPPSGGALPNPFQPQHKVVPLEQSVINTRIISTEPTTGQTTLLQSPIMDSATTVSSSTLLTQLSPPRTLASILPSEMTPQQNELKLFAEEFKNRRIRLGYTQGAVGQSLADKGYSNFAQSTISRFEQMQLSPTNAAAIKLVLEKWLQEAENPSTASSTSASLPLMASRKRKRRAVFTQQTKSTLDDYFKQNPRPNRHVIEKVAHELDLLPEEVRVWFCNKRQKEKQATTTTCNRGINNNNNVQIVYKYPYDRESSLSLSSSGANSPSSAYENTISQNRNTPSPQRNTATTPFTIEELSKSSCTSSIKTTSPFIVSPKNLIVALSAPRMSFQAQSTPSVVNNTPKFHVAPTTA